MVVAFATVAGPAIAAGPGDAIMAAHADLVRVPPDARPHVRYFSAYHADADTRKELGAVLSFWCNSLSREPDIVRPVECGPGLWRVDIRDYGWGKATWEKLADVDPYFHVLGVDAVPVEEFDEYGYWHIDDKQVAKGTPGAVWKTTRRERKATVKLDKVPQPAPWLPAKEYGALALALQSNLPIARADWWIWQTGQQVDRTAGYYDFLGLGKKEDDFLKLVAADLKLAKKVKKEIAAVLDESGVSESNRAIDRHGTINGGLWKTHDFKTSTFRQNTIRLLDGETEPPAGDANEMYGHLSNGLFAYWLQDGVKGERQDSAPDFVGGDKSSPRPDSRIHIGISCVRCHVEGLRPIDDYMRRVYDSPQRQFGTLDYEKYKRIRQLFFSDLAGHLEEDVARYSKALAKCNGLTPAKNAAAFARVWELYSQSVTVEVAAAELGCAPAVFVKALEAYGRSIDPVLIGFVGGKKTIRRDHWHETYSIAQRYLNGVK